MRENTNEFDFGKLFAIFRSNWIVIVATTVLLGLLGFCYSAFFISPTYSSNLLLCVSNTTSGSEQYIYYNQTDIMASNKLVNACGDIITSNSVLEKVSDKLGNKYSAGAIRRMISISSEEESQLFKLSINCNNPDDACLIANTIGDIAPSIINEYLKPTSLKVVDPAKPSSVPISPNITRNALVFCLIGLVVSYGFFFLRSQFDIYIRNEDDIKNIFGDVPILGVVPVISGEAVASNKRSKGKWNIWKRNRKIQKLVPSTELINNKTSFFVKEAYKDLRTNILFSMPDSKCKIIAVSSSVMSEGKSTTCVNTAITFAEMGKKVLIIDTDMRRPRLHRLMKSTSTPGLSNLLLNLSTYDESVFATNYPNLDVIFAGEISPNPTELLSSTRMKEILDEMSKHYEYIFVDTPAIAPIADTVIISKLVHGHVIVTRQGVTEKKILENCVEKLLFSNAKILGYVVNGFDLNTHSTSKYKYNYKYREEYR